MSVPSEMPAIAYDELSTSKSDSCFLGQGSFSMVYRCYHRTIGDVAVKILNTRTRHPIKSFNREGLMHLRANTCQHILTLYGVAQKESFVGLVLEYMPYGSLATVVQQDRHIPVPWTFRIRALSEIASAIHYLHHLTDQRRLVHCDLKLENVLLNADLHAKIGDFGGADFSTFTGQSLTATSSGTAGVKVDKHQLQYTLCYTPPELMKRLDMRRTPPMDVYSFAIVMYVMITRHQPFEGKEKGVIIHAVTEGQRPENYLEDVEEDLEEARDSVGQQVYKLLCHLMPQCWCQNPSQRLPIANVRDSLTTKFRSFPEQSVENDMSKLKRSLVRGDYGLPGDAAPIYEKYRDLVLQGDLGPGMSTSPGMTSQRIPNQTSLRPSPRTQSPRTQSASDATPTRHVGPPSASRSLSHPATQPPTATTTKYPQVSPANDLSQLYISQPPQQEAPRSLPSVELNELEASFRDPYLRQGNAVTMITDLAAVKNAQLGHGGWDEKLLNLRDIQGTVRSVDSNGDVTVDFSGIESHRFNPSSLTKLPSSNDLSVGDFVEITLEKEVVKVMQENHGGWIDDMESYFKMPALVFRFLPDRDVLVVYKSGMYFRYNPEILVKAPQHREVVRLNDNPNISIGDYVCHELELEVIKELQQHCGGWNDTMADLRGKVGKFVFADYHGRAFIAYGSKLCFVFNAAVLNKLSKEEAAQRFKNSRDEVRKSARARAENQTRRHRFAVDDKVRVRLPLDIVVELQKGHGGWCYQMLEVYSSFGIVKEFDEGSNAQVLFDTGNKWTINPAALEKVSPDDSGAVQGYTPPFKIGDKVRVKLKDLSNVSLNKMRQAFKMLEIPEDKAEILMKTGTVLGIDDDIDVIVSFGDGKNYGLKPEQLEKL